MTAFSTLIAALQASKIDVIAAAMYITPPRQEIVDELLRGLQRVEAAESRIDVDWPQ